MHLALDTETTGTDSFHGCKPFLVTGCDGDYNYLFRGYVDHSTREVYWDSTSTNEVIDLIHSATSLIFHNTNFDRRMLASIGIDLTPYLHKVHDTLLLAHLLCNGDKHGLKDICIKYLRYYNDDEQTMSNVVASERIRLANTGTAIAKLGHPHFPAAPKNTRWGAMDMWLAMDHAMEYGVKDAERTWLMWQVFMQAIRDDIGIYQPVFKWYPDHIAANNLECQYRFRLSLLPVLYDMQTYGICIYLNKVDRLITHLEFQLQGLTNLIAHHSGWIGYLNPDSDKHLEKLLYSNLRLDPFKLTKGGANSTDKETLKALFEEHPDLITLQYLSAWKEVDTELQFIKAYKLWSSPDKPNHQAHQWTSNHNQLPTTTQTTFLPTKTNRQVLIPSPSTNSHDNNEEQQSEHTNPPTHNQHQSSPSPPPEKCSDGHYSPIYRLHGTTNPTGTKWTRNSASDPNIQNFKKELSYLFGPPPGFYWLYMDVVNIELRIWAYETNCTSLIKEFEKGESVHIIIAKAVRPHEIEAGGGVDNWKKTDPKHKQYTKTKNGTFALTYGGGEKKINDTYGIPNAYHIIKDRLPGVVEYAQQLQKTSNDNIPIFGYPTLHTIQGYPLQIPRTKPHKATSGRVQGTAGLIVQHMMVEMTKDEVCQSHSCHFIQQVHDSLTIEIPNHPHSPETNAHLVALAESIGSRHIPTCPMDPEVILPTQFETFKLKIPTILPEMIHGYKVTYYFQDGIGWIAEGKAGSDIIEIQGSTHQQARDNFICYIEGTPF